MRANAAATVGELLGSLQWSLCVSCGAWLATHLLEHVDFIAWDASYVHSTVVPVLRGVACFFIEHVYVEYEQGSGRGTVAKEVKVVHTGPTTSPENSYRMQGRLGWYCAGDCVHGMTSL